MYKLYERSFVLPDKKTTYTISLKVMEHSISDVLSNFYTITLQILLELQESKEHF